MAKWHWTKHLFSASIPVFPLAYVAVHGFRDKKWISWMFVGDLDIPLPVQLIEIVEDELDKNSSLKRAEFTVRLSSNSDAFTYGGFFLSRGAHMQLSFRTALRYCSEQKQDEFKNVVAISSGALKTKQVFDLSTNLGQKIFDNLPLTEASTRFLIQRELHRANSGEFFLLPMFIWCICFIAGFVIFSNLSKLTDPYLSLLFSFMLAVSAFYSFYPRYIVYREKKLDIETYKKSNDYIVGAREYFESSIKLNQLLRSVMDNKSFFKANGDIAKEPWPYSQRVKVLETFLNAQKFVN